MRISSETRRAIVAAVGDGGMTDRQAAAALGVHQRTVSRWRRRAGIPPKWNATTLADKYAKYAVELDGGCVGWTGRRGASGAPLIRHRNRDVSAAAVAFTMRTGFAPVGQVRGECSTPHCVAEAHVLDTPSRREWRIALRVLKGWEPHWEACPHADHPWAEHGRVKADLTLYCALCAKSQNLR